MTSQIAFLDDEVGLYVADHSTPPNEVEARLIAETQQMAGAQMQIGHPQARFMAGLTKILRPQLVVEIGTFTGYSALVVAQALVGEAKLIACDISEEWTSIGRRYWEEAGVADRIEVRIGPALETLEAFGPEATVDMAFIDADKGGYIGYFEQLVPLLSTTGVILVDNVLWDGQVTK